jgi:hypothetical protein
LKFKLYDPSCHSTSVTSLSSSFNLTGLSLKSGMSSLMGNFSSVSPKCLNDIRQLWTLALILHLYLQAFYNLDIIFILTISLFLFQSMYYILAQYYGAKIWCAILASSALCKSFLPCPHHLGCYNTLYSISTATIFPS